MFAHNKAKGLTLKVSPDILALGFSQKKREDFHKTPMLFEMSLIHTV
jgi:hypothetical protein